MIWFTVMDEILFEHCFQAVGNMTFEVIKLPM